MKILGGNAISNKSVLNFYERGCSFRRFNCNRESIPEFCVCSYKESMFANIVLSFRNTNDNLGKLSSHTT